MDDEMLNINTEQANEIVCNVIDMALKQYLFESNEVIDVDLSQFDERTLKQNMVIIRKEIEDKLDGSDSIECGITLDGEAFMRIHKRIAQEPGVDGRRRKRRRKAKNVECRDEVERRHALDALFDNL